MNRTLMQRPLDVEMLYEAVTKFDVALTSEEFRYLLGKLRNGDEAEREIAVMALAAEDFFSASTHFRDALSDENSRRVKMAILWATYNAVRSQPTRAYEAALVFDAAMRDSDVGIRWLGKVLFMRAFTEADEDAKKSLVESLISCI